MDELNTNAVETTETTDEFLSDWEDDVSTEESTDSVEESSEVESTEADKAEENTTGENTENVETEVVAENSTPTESEGTTDAELSWQIKVLGEEKVIKASEITPAMLQKASDYDRIHEKWNDAKPVMEVMQQFAKNANMDVIEYVRYLREQVKMSEGASEADAKHQVELEDKEADLKAREEAIAEQEAERNKVAEAEKTNKAKIDADLAEFRNAFPEAYEKAKGDPKQIPQSVWDDVNKGSTLSVAYAKYAVAQANAIAQQAQEKANIAQQNAKNSNRSTGSMRSAGDENAQTDDFLKDW